MRISEPVKIVTASLTPGDAISSYIITLKNLLEDSGLAVHVYADHISPYYGAIARSAKDYCPGSGVLWYHYSVYAEISALIQTETDTKVIDYHGVSPPHLFTGYDRHLARMCQRGIDELPRYSEVFDVGIVHSEYTRSQLLRLGFGNVHKLPLVVDTGRFTGVEDAVLSSWLRSIPYLLFVGRIVPQKDIRSMLSIFQRLHWLRPDAVLILAGGRQLAPRYQKQIENDIKHYHLESCVLLTDQINSTAILTSLYRHAKFTLVTSEWESFCVPIVESMRFGTPLVVHNIPPLPEVMGKAGIIIDKTKPENAAGVIHDLWNCEAGYAELVQRCSEQAAAFTESTLASQLFLLFESVFPDA